MTDLKNPSATAPSNDLLLRALNCQPVPRAPVWLMRQAGRSDPEYLAYRERAGLSLYELFRSPEHAIHISMLPKRIGVDAIILYQDILTPLEPMGAVFQFTPGPTLSAPVRDPAQIDSLKNYDPQTELSFIAEAIHGVLGKLEGQLPLLGFAGAPFTLAAFLIEGKSPGAGLPNAGLPHTALPNTMAMMRERPEEFSTLLDRLTDMTIAYLNFQAEAGVHAVQLFESLGDQIPRDAYESFIQPSHRKIFSGMRKGLPAILFVRESPFPDLMLESGAGALSLGTGISLREMRDRGQRQITVQGNVDNRLLAEGTPEQVTQAVRACLDETGGQGHILNLSHGVLPNTPFHNVKAFVEAAKQWRPGDSP